MCNGKKEKKKNSTVEPELHTRPNNRALRAAAHVTVIRFASPGREAANYHSLNGFCRVLAGSVWRGGGVERGWGGVGVGGTPAKAPRLRIGGGHTKPGFTEDLKHLGQPFVPFVCRHLEG